MCFNPRARTGRDEVSIGKNAGFGFQSTRPHGARLGLVPHDADKLGFNPRARTGRDCKGSSLNSPSPVSIHAPARGATLNGAAITSTKRFNPRARTGRDFACAMCNDVKLFQSTRPHGARQQTTAEGRRDEVSIHAPARGATTYSHAGYTLLCFNPRARTGRDTILFNAIEIGRFQSTRPHGARPRLPC